MVKGFHVFCAVFVCVSLLTEGLCSATNRTSTRSWYRRPEGWVAVTKNFLNMMANMMAGPGGNATHSMTHSEKSLMKDAVNRIDDAGRKMGVKDWATTGMNTAKDTAKSWVNSALNWITG